MKNYKIEIKWAVIFVVASLLWMVFEKAMGWHGEKINQHALFSSLFAVVAILIYVLALLDKRQNFYNGKMTWKEGFVSGLVISILVAVVSPLTQFITLELISPEFLNNASKNAVAMGAMTQEAAESYFSYGSYLIQAFFGAIVMGMVTSAIVAFFLKTKK